MGGGSRVRDLRILTGCGGRGWGGGGEGRATVSRWPQL